MRVHSFLLVILVELFTGPGATAATIATPADLILSHEHYLSNGEEAPLPITKEQFFAFGRLIGRDFAGATPVDCAALGQFMPLARATVALESAPEKRVPLSYEEHQWLRAAQAGSFVLDPTGLELIGKLREGLGVALVQSLKDRPRVPYGGFEVPLTHEQVALVEIARADPESTLRIGEVRGRLGWQGASPQARLFDEILAINGEALIFAGATMFRYVKGSGYRLLEPQTKPYAKTPRRRKTPAGELTLVGREAAVWDQFGPDILDAHVAITSGEMESLGLPLDELLETLNALNARAMSLKRRPFYRTFEIRLSDRRLQFDFDGTTLEVTGCGPELARPRFPGARKN